MKGTRHIWGINMDGTTTNDPATEVGRAAMTMGKPAATVEKLKITLSGAGGAKGKMLVEFENVTASVAITVNQTSCDLPPAPCVGTPTNRHGRAKYKIVVLQSGGLKFRRTPPSS